MGRFTLNVRCSTNTRNWIVHSLIAGGMLMYASNNKKLDSVLQYRHERCRIATREAESKPQGPSQTECHVERKWTLDESTKALCDCYLLRVRSLQ